jgi:transcriptional regulator with XRE-family HTH domain
MESGPWHWRIGMTYRRRITANSCIRVDGRLRSWVAERCNRRISGAGKDSADMGRNNRRATVAGPADRHSADLAGRLGAALRDRRRRARLTQSEAAARAGLSQSTWSDLENGRDARYTLATWDRAAHGVGTSLNAYLPETSAADQPRDAVQLRAQELVISTAISGGWHGLPEEQIDREAGKSRFADVLLARPRHQPSEIALIEIIDWFEDVGAPMRDWPRRVEAVERRAIASMFGDQAVPRVSGCWLIRATRRNRELVADHANLFRNRFPGSGRAWLAALGDTAKQMPGEPGLLWVSVDGTRIWPMRRG